MKALRSAWFALLAVALACARHGPEPVSIPPPPPAPIEPLEPLPNQPPSEVFREHQVTIEAPFLLRVGLATDLDTFELPCCDARLSLELGEQRLPLEAALRIAPAATIANRAVYRLQVAALKDEGQATRLAREIEGSTQLASEAVFDAGTDLYRVRVGRFATREQAEAAKGRMVQLGLDHTWVSTEGGDLENPGLEVTLGERRFQVSTRELAIDTLPGIGFPHDGARYRGKLVVFLNDRGKLNLIDELSIEDYLRGVVPKEMGPELYRQLEVLKAQAVAARTYTLRNLGEFAGEGYDICSTPRCQVYGGLGAEHPLSDRAIAETAGQVVLYDGEPAEALYSASCGGHTENVEVIFPLKNGPYLRGVRCLESGVDYLEGDGAAGRALPSFLVRTLLGADDGSPARMLAARFERLAGLAGLAASLPRLRSVARREVRRATAAAFDLALDRVLGPVLEEGARAPLEALVENPPASWRPEDFRLASYFARSRLLDDPQDAALGAEELDELLFELALYLRVLRREDADYLEKKGSGLRVLSGGAERTYALPPNLVTFEKNGDGYRSGGLELMAGDQLDLFWRRDQLLGLARRIDARPVSFERDQGKIEWKRYRRDAEVRRSVQTRYPGFPFEGFEVLDRGVSGRIGKLRLLGAGGKSLEVEGLAVRWTLDLPDTLFTARRVGGEDSGGWQFSGRGWGHGVGLCQTGAYAMAARGYDYRHILAHYYRGVELGRMKLVQTQYRREPVVAANAPSR